MPSSDTSSYCNARGRLRLSFLQQIHQRVINHLHSRIGSRDQWNGFTLKAMDGSSVQLMDTAKNQLVFPQPSVQKPGCGFPTMGIVGLLNLGHGGWEHIETCPYTQHDTKAAATLATHLSEGDLLLADRDFCSYELIARRRKQGAHILMRLHHARDKALDWRRRKKIDSNQHIVTWQRPQRPHGTSLTREQLETLPETMELRLIRFHYENRVGKKALLIVVTTLLDPQQHAEEDLADLYARRWDIELKLRDLKTTHGMERFDLKSPEMAHKTLWMSVIAYNLIRSLMQKAAAEAGQPVWHISFKGVLDLVSSSHESLRICAGKPRKQQAAMSQIISICATKLIDIRPLRREPRAIKRRPKPYQYLTTHRSEFTEIHLGLVGFLFDCGNWFVGHGLRISRIVRRVSRKPVLPAPGIEQPRGFR